MVLGRHRCAIQFFVCVFVCLLFSLLERGHHALYCLYNFITDQNVIFISFINDYYIGILYYIILYLCYAILIV